MLTIEQLNPEGEFNKAVRAYADGNPEPLADFIQQHGISPGYEADTVANAIRNPDKYRSRANSADRTRELLRLYESIMRIEREAENDPELPGYKTKLVWREPSVNLSGKISIYRLIAEQLSVTPDAVERIHKRMRKSK